MSQYPAIGASILNSFGGQGLNLFDRGFSRFQDTFDRERAYQEQRLAEEREKKRRDEAAKKARTQQLTNIGIGVGAGALTGGVLAAPGVAAGETAGQVAGQTAGQVAGETAGKVAGDVAVNTVPENALASVNDTLVNTPLDLTSSATNLPASELNPGLTGLEGTSSRTLSTPASFNEVTGNGGGAFGGNGSNAFIDGAGGSDGGNPILKGALLGGITGGLVSSGVPGLVNTGATIQQASPLLNPNLRIAQDRLALSRENAADTRNYRNERLGIDKDRLAVDRENAANLKGYRDKQLALETDPTTPENIARKSYAEAADARAAKDRFKASPITQFLGGVKDVVDTGVKEVGKFSRSPVGQITTAAYLTGQDPKESLTGFLNKKTGPSATATDSFTRLLEAGGFDDETKQQLSAARARMQAGQATERDQLNLAKALSDPVINQDPETRSLAQQFIKENASFLKKPTATGDSGTGVSTTGGGTPETIESVRQRAANAKSDAEAENIIVGSDLTDEEKRQLLGG